MSRIPSYFIGLAVAVLFVVFWIFQPADSEVKRAFYLWENTKTELTPYERESLQKLEIKKLYVKLFEIEKNDVYGIFPTAKSQFSEYGADTLNVEIIPTIYVRNEVFKKTSRKELEEFASNLDFLVGKKMSEQFAGKQLQEIQVDCDWTESTQKNYFEFLRLLKKRTNLKISATLRLYAYKFPDKMGVLPVDRAMLMCYNLLSVHQQETKNSILDLEELEKYLVGAAKYPVPLDVALPVYSAMHVYRNNTYTTTLYNDGQLDEKMLDHTKGLWYRVNTDVPLQNLFLRQGDKVKYEKISPELLERAIKLIRSKVRLERDFTLSLFQLNEYELKQHSDEKLASYYQLFSVFQNFACGPFYPYGDEVRFSLLKPNYVPVYGMGRFHYTAFAFTDSYTAFEKDEFEKSDENVAAWHAYFKGEFTHKDIYEVIYKVKVKQLSRMKKSNAFVKALYSDRYKDVLDYIVFAKKISDLNSWAGDPWERDRNSGKSVRNKQIDKAAQSADAAKDAVLKRRYAYLAVRLAFYNNDYNGIAKLFSKYFEGQTPQDVVYYWALHFKVSAEESSPRRNVEAALVFRYSHEKRFPVHFMYDREISREQTLKACKNEEEKSAVEFFLTSRKVDRALPQIKNFAAGSNDENLLCFLLLRETNKLEDWILTPYYSEFQPSLNQEYYERQDYFSFRKRIADDRKYAADLANWAGKQDIKESSKKAWWKSMTAYLHFLAGGEHLETAEKMLVKQSEDPALLRFNKMLSALISAERNAKPDLENTEVQQLIRSEADLENDKFLFALGRELEFRGNTLDAAYLFSKINKGENWENYTFWRSRELHNTLFLDFYEHYFFYLDAQYTPEQVSELIKDAKTGSTSEFDTWKKQSVKKDLTRLYDLLGTKYLRQNKLQASLKAFEQVNDTLWKSKHYYYRDYINANPFYTDFYSEHSPTEGDTIRYTKPEIVRKLIYYLGQFDQKSGREKAYYAFQAGNCYFNMTQYGNSWMMRRYFWTSQATHTGLEDDEDYFQCRLAQKYYLEASHATKNEEISALALRMAGRCEKYRLYDLNRDYEGEDYEAYIFSKNKYYQKLKQDYPEHYEPLISNCGTFGGYYAKLK